jgi:hypothetical protein
VGIRKVCRQIDRRDEQLLGSPDVLDRLLAHARGVHGDDPENDRAEDAQPCCQAQATGCRSELTPNREQAASRRQRDIAGPAHRDLLAASLLAIRRVRAMLS